ncbi:MAG: hypothetical protein IJ366_09430 [Clostridia bacterium]|nr:hypothetical protein [Clostridia bacterium]
MIQASKLKKRILEFATLVGFEYMGKNGYVDPFNENSFDLFFDGVTVNVDSIEKVMGLPFFDGKSLSEICDKLIITEGM